MYFEAFTLFCRDLRVFLCKIVASKILVVYFFWQISCLLLPLPIAVHCLGCWVWGFKLWYKAAAHVGIWNCLQCKCNGSSYIFWNFFGARNNLIGPLVSAVSGMSCFFQTFPPKTINSIWDYSTVKAESCR